jgi:phosphomannomutase
MIKIKFGTDGWRAIIAKEYTLDNVMRVADATAQFMLKNGGKSAVVGYDCRFGGPMFAEATAQVLAAYGIKVYLGQGFVSTPMVSLGVVKKSAFLGVVITASHNPPDYNGYKLKSHYGGPSVPADIAAVEALIPDTVPVLQLPSVEQMLNEGLLEIIDLEQLYVDECKANFDLKAINNSFVRLAYDAMYGAGQNVVRRLLSGVTEFNCTHNPGFEGQAPEPIHRNLKKLSAFIANNSGINCGLANDGDADRIGMYDEDGVFVDSHQILLLLIHYMHKYKGMSGKVVVSFPVTDKVKKLCDIYGIECIVTKIGFKYIAEIMIAEKVLVGGEESGGIAVAGHIPERDGIWVGLVLLEFMAKSGKTLRELIKEIYSIVGPFAYDRADLHLTNEQKEKIVENCKNGNYTSFGNYSVQRVEDLDGYKFYLNDETWVMVRASGTEPVLRVYVQAIDNEAVKTVLDAAKTSLLQ